jgi:hypothetical protein
MAPAPVERRARALPFLAFLFVVVGGCQMYCAVGELGPRGYLPVPSEGNEPEVAEHLREVQRLVSDDPNRAAIAVATVVGGGMLLIGGLLLWRRRASAIWWTKQALGANLLVAAGAMASIFVHLYRTGGALSRELAAAVAADPEGQGGDVGQLLDFLWVREALPRTTTILVFAYFLWRITRPDVREELDEGIP